MELVRRDDDGERVAQGALAEPEPVRVGERAPDEREHSPEAVGREEHRLVGRARRAHRPAGAREVADEPVHAAALDAALEMRDVAGEPQELELERERDRIERGTSARARPDRVHRREEPRQRLERALVPLLLDEQPQHRLRADEPDREAVRILARRPMRVDERDAGDGVQLAGALVEEELDVRERLEPRAEARLRLADALRDRADAAAIGACTGGGRGRPRRNGTSRSTTASVLYVRPMRPV